MFLLIPSEDPTKWKAKISEDNLTIEWPKGAPTKDNPNEGSWTEPPWHTTFASDFVEGARYEKFFKQALSDYTIARQQVAEYRELPRATNELASSLIKQEWRDSGGKVLDD